MPVVTDFLTGEALICVTPRLSAKCIFLPSQPSFALHSVEGQSSVDSCEKEAQLNNETEKSIQSFL